MARPLNLAHIALGSNLGDSRALLSQAIEGLAGLGRVEALSPIYRTPPFGPPQPHYLNAAVAMHTTLAPAPLLAKLKEIERALGRQSNARWGPRLIDLDLLLVGDRVEDSLRVTLPHPALHLRAFVLVPLAEIAGELRHPLLGRTIWELRDALPAADRLAIKRLDLAQPAR